MDARAPLPSSVRWGDHAIPVRLMAQADLDAERGEPGSLGYYWTGDDETPDYIAISADQPPEGQVLVLIHELLHVVEHQLIAMELIPDDGVNHDFIELGAGSLFALMGMAGMLVGVDPGKAERFVDGAARAEQGAVEEGT